MSRRREVRLFGVKELEHMTQSYLIISDSKEQTDTYIEELQKKFLIDPLDVSYFESETSSFGIKEVRNMQHKLLLKPFKSIRRIMVIPFAKKLTVPAQNALLKTLEEPPETSIIILISSTKESFLPTVLSRCTIINIPGSQMEEKSPYSLQSLNSLFSSMPSEKLKHAQEIGKNKDIALAWLESTILTLRNELLSGSSVKQETKIIQILKSLQKAHTVISTTNINLRFCLEDLFLSM